MYNDNLAISILDTIKSIGLSYWLFDVIKLITVVITSSIVGIERANKRHSAGFRTFLISGIIGVLSGIADTCVFAIVSVPLPLISAATILGVTTISSKSVIISSKAQTLGLTTALALWCNVILSIMIGFGQFIIAIIAFLVLMFSVSCLPALEKYLKNRSNHFEFHIEIFNATDLKTLVKTMRELGLIIDRIEKNQVYSETGLNAYTFMVSIASAELKHYKTHKEIIEALGTLDYVYYIEEIE